MSPPFALARKMRHITLPRGRQRVVCCGRNGECEAEGEGEREPGWAMGTEAARQFLVIAFWRSAKNAMTEPLAQMRPLKRPAGACRHEAGRRGVSS